MLNPDAPAQARPKRSPAVERVSPGTINRIKTETVRETFEAKIEELEEEILVRKTAAEEVAAELLAITERAEKAEAQNAALEKKIEETEKSALSEKEELKKEIAALKEALEKAESKTSEANAAVVGKMEALKKRIALEEERKKDLEERLADAERTALSSSVLLDKPAHFSISEKFPGEIREHLLATLAEAMRSADQGGKERRAQILEAILCCNPLSDELDSRRTEIKDIMKNAGSTIGENTVAKLEKMGFRFISGNKHNKLDWGGVRVIIPKTPSDHRSFLNSAIDIVNKVF